MTDNNPLCQGRYIPSLTIRRNLFNGAISVWRRSGAFLIAFPVFIFMMFIHNRAIGQTTTPYFQQLHQKYAGHWHKTLRFEQESFFYQNDSLTRFEMWYESARFPYDFRIDMGKKTEGRGVIYKKDSTYRYINNRLQSVTTDINPYIFLIGGMYFMPYEDAVAILRSRKIDPSKQFETNWKGRRTWVIGASREGESQNQIWVDAAGLYLVRVIEYKGHNKVDAHMEDHIRIGKGWSETKMTFYVNDKLRQLEKYHNIKTDVLFPEGHFLPPPR